MANINGLTGTAAEVDSNNNLKTNLPTTIAQAGFAAMAGENDPGDVTGSRYLYSPEVTDDYRLRVGVDRIIDQEVFNYANQNTGKHSYTASTLTFVLSGGYLQSNGSNITTINTAARFFTQRNFGINAQQTSIYVETNAAFSASLSGTTNTTIDFGLFQDSASAPYAPSDGVYFRATSAGISGVINFNGTETVVGPFVASYGGSTWFPTIGRVYQFVISVSNREVKFWIDDVLYGKLETQAGNYQPFMSQSLPYKIRHAIGGTLAGNTQNLKVGGMSIYWGDIERDKPWGQVSTCMGNGLQVQQGATTGGQLSTYALGAAPATLTLTASTAPATNTLGGIFALPVAVAVGESDYPLFAWLNPAGTTAIPGKMFVCTGVIVSHMWVSIAALTGGPIVFNYAVGFGSTAASLATTETTTFTSGTTKIARKYPIGACAFAATAALGTTSPGFQVNFPDGMVVNAGEYLHIILRCQGTALTAGTAQVRGGVTVLGYFEN